MAPNDAYDRYRETRFFGSLDGLRCIAILAVIWHHTGVRLDSVLLSQQGRHGVDLFFVISGFLITTLLLRERERHGTISLKLFYMRRSLRIFPLYYSVLLVYVIMVLVFERGSRAGSEFWGNLPAYATYTSNWFVDLEGRVIFYFAWSLATEEQFYLMWPTVQKWLGGWRPVMVAVALILLREVVEISLNQGWIPKGALPATIIMSIHPAILGGVIAAHLLHMKSTFSVMNRLLANRVAAPLLLVFVFLSLSAATPMSVVWSLMVLLVLSCVVNESNGLAPLLKFRVMAHVGVVSYGAYMMHMLCYHVVIRGMRSLGADSPLFHFAASAALVIAVATVSYRYYESFFLRLKQRFTVISTLTPAGEVVGKEESVPGNSG
jgi:peptidoglycan/LPS O-acetylase OafA/YrhL